MPGSPDVREFLVSRRARVQPQDAGLPTFGTNRRVAGLRREEVALLAGISVEYYTRLERGGTKGVSDEVLDGVARALQLDDVERSHLVALVRGTTSTAGRRRRPTPERVRPSVLRILDSLTTPAFVRNGRLDVLATNRLGAALYAPMLDRPARPANTARFLFLDPDATQFFAEWATVAHDAVAVLRAEAGRDPYDRRLTDLIGELSTRSPEFRVLWAAHDVKIHRNGVKRYHHPIVGQLTLSYEALDLAADPGQRMLVYTAEPGSASADALNLLASWTSDPRPVP